MLCVFLPFAGSSIFLEILLSLDSAKRCDQKPNEVLQDGAVFHEWSQLFPVSKLRSPTSITMKQCASKQLLLPYGGHADWHLDAFGVASIELFVAIGSNLKNSGDKLPISSTARLPRTAHSGWKDIPKFCHSWFLQCVQSGQNDMIKCSSPC